MIPGGLYNFLSPSSNSHLAPSTTPNPPPLIPNPPTPPSAFTQLLDDAELPPPGPDYFAARRALWTKPSSDSLPPHPPPSSRIKLEALLDQPGALESDEVWHVGLDKVWKGLVSGGRLKNFLPLRTVVKILYAGWRRDGTWPENTMIADNDNFFGTSDLPVAPASQDDLTSGALTDESSMAMLGKR
ncbi:hypothetical protein BV25DRAFT_1821566 [Artomyces pyxidatus]|uniref:Uncharacterized protein n=1 Tax=Artomyces pyxidatus TaxID=48021 RepID=A0ACB8TCY8_9AGAM|nr:hypothetical protein BV25DRAFT_1821566 [Artomyces pyxidatus]